MFVLHIYKHTCFHEKPLKTIQAFIKNGQNIRGFPKRPCTNTRDLYLNF